MGFTLNQHEQEKQIKKLQKKKDQDTTNYNDLDNLPQINSVELKGDKSLSDLGIQGETLEAASGESLTLSPTSEGRALLHTAYGMSTQDGTPTPSSPADIVSAKADFRSVGKNLISYPWYDSSKTANGVTFTDNGDGSVTLNGTCTALTFYTFWGGRALLKPTTFLKVGVKYKVSLEVISGSITRNNNDSSLALRNYPGNVTDPHQDVFIIQAIEESVEYAFTYTQLENYIYTLLWYQCSAGVVFDNWRIRPMLRLADVTDNTYEPYQKMDMTTDLTLRAIEVTSSDAYNLVRDNKYYIADTLDYTEDDGWSVTRRVEEFSIDGTEQGWSYIDTVGSERFSITLNALNLPADKYIGKDISSHFQEKRNGVIIDNSQPWGYFRIGIDGWFVLTDNDNTIGTLSAFKTWLGENTPQFMYCLATPTTENITTAQALALLGLKTYDESTTISSQAEPSCTVAVEYAKEKLGAVALTAYNKAVADGLNITAITPHILPDAPTTDGSYNLKVTVTSGEAAYSWEAVTP